MSNIDNIFPQNVPLTGHADFEPNPVNPVVGTEAHAEVYQTPPEARPADYTTIAVTVPEVGRAVHHTNPQPPAIGVSVRTPITTPLGLVPQFKTPTLDMPQNYGNS